MTNELWEEVAHAGLPFRLPSSQWDLGILRSGNIRPDQRLRCGLSTLSDIEVQAFAARCSTKHAAQIHFNSFYCPWQSDLVQSIH